MGANYIEANEGLSKKDSVFRLRISRKGAKECRYFLRLLEPGDAEKAEREKLVAEAIEIRNILSTMIRNSE
ncbi:MAG: four helix bundle protein [Planctomycetota bacterium]|nr:four helix bundle protein [Planctomycetota bacterium]